LKKVLVTGACGYLGARLTKYLVEEGGYGVTAFGSFNPSDYIEWTSLMEEIIVGDIRDETTINSLTEKQFDVVIHLISLDHYKSEDNPNFVSSINVMPTWNLLDKLTKNGLKKFIYFSTIQVYENLPNKIITEDHPPQPVNTYGLTHLLSENICNYYNEKTETKCINVRLSNSYGSPVFKENNCWWLVINDLCKSAYENNSIKLLSDGSPQRDFIHISDVCKGIEILLNTDKKNLQNNIYHISSGQTLTILELSHSVKEIYNLRYKKNIPVLLPNKMVSETPDKYLETERYIINNSKLTSLGFSPETSLENGINEIFDYIDSIYG
tara:strand:- start:144 stop:1118 length:975 start_codon:yes stop_codon:yes gene_type:complete